ncbi:MAG: glycosyltransferase family 1 protein [Candidatus Shapirobacteria bacterium]|nr:glycosyltransferase family 1 protein [Candidatus Shapirobacteria bacterium]
MLIGIDGNEANVSNRVGVGQYAYNLLINLSKIDQDNQYIIYLKNQPSSDFPKSTPNWQYRVFGPKKLWSRFSLPLYLFFQNEKLNLFFSPSHYSPKFCPCPTIPTIHDLGYLQFKSQFTKKDLYQLINWTKQSINKATHIITVSQFSKDEIIKNYQIDSTKISIAYNGVDIPPTINSQTQQKILSNYNLKTNNYFLYLGTLKPNKNIPFLVRSFSKFLKQITKTSHPTTPKLVIAGKKGWLFDEIFQTVKEEGIEKQVIFTDFVSETQKWTLYQNAICSILPSTYEGFGIPVIESMKIGTPVIASTIPPLKEVIENNGLFIDPKNEADLVKKMIEISNSKIREKYSTLGKKQADKFTWGSTAKSVLQVFEKLIN